MDLDLFIERISNCYNLKPDDGRLSEIRILCAGELNSDIFDFSDLYDSITKKFTRCPVRAHIYQEISELRAGMKLDRRSEAEDIRKAGQVCAECRGKGGLTFSKVINGVEYSFCNLCTVCHGKGVDFAGNQNIDPPPFITHDVDLESLAEAMGIR